MSMINVLWHFLNRTDVASHLLASISLTLTFLFNPNCPSGINNSPVENCVR